MRVNTTIGATTLVGATLLAGIARSDAEHASGPLTPTATLPLASPPQTTLVPPVPTLRIGQLNAYNLFDTVDTPRVQDEVLTPLAYETKLTKLALTIRDVMGSPDIIALQEVEGEHVLRALAARPELVALGYEPIIIEGNDPRGIDVAYLYRPSRVELISVEQRNTTHRSPTGRNIKLFTRPPLVATFRPLGTGATDGARAGSDITLIVNHFTSKLEGEPGARKRLLQAAWVSSLADGSAGVANLQRGRVIVLGDLNEAPGEPAYESLLRREGRTERELVNAADQLPVSERYSYRQGRTRTLLDHVLLSPELAAGLRTVQIPHVNSDPSPRLGADPTTPLRASDHDPVIVKLKAAAAEAAAREARPVPAVIDITP